MEPWLLGLLISLIPYTMQSTHIKGGRQVVIRAFSWRLTIRWMQWSCSWSLSIPLIEHLHH